MEKIILMKIKNYQLSPQTSKVSGPTIPRSSPSHFQNHPQYALIQRKVHAILQYTGTEISEHQRVLSLHSSHTTGEKQDCTLSLSKSYLVCSYYHTFILCYVLKVTSVWGNDVCQSTWLDGQTERMAECSSGD